MAAARQTSVVTIAAFRTCNKQSAEYRLNICSTSERSASVEEVMASMPVQTISRFRLVRQIGRGAQGKVFLATDPQLGRTVAVKTVTPQAASSQMPLRGFSKKPAQQAACLILIWCRCMRQACTVSALMWFSSTSRVAPLQKFFVSTV